MADATRTVRTRFDGDASGLRRAARQAEGDIDKFGRNAGRSFTSGIRTWLTGEGGQGLFSAGRTGGTVFGSGFAGVLSTPVLGPIVLAALLGVVAFAMPLIGTAIAGALVLAFGAGLAGLGVVFAAQSEKVKTAFQGLIDFIVPKLKEISEPFEDTLVAIAGFIQRTFDFFKPSLEKAFAELAPVITGFADDFFLAMQELRPVIQPITDAFKAMLEDLGPELPNMMRDIRDGIVAVAESIADNPKPFTDLIGWLFAIVGKGLEFVAWLNSPSGRRGMREFGAAAKDLAEDIATIAGAIRDIISAAESLRQSGGFGFLSPEDVRDRFGSGGLLPIPSQSSALRSGPFNRSTRFGGNDAWFAFAGDGMSRVGGPTSFNVDTRVYLDGSLIDARVDTKIAQSESQQAWRANTGRR